MEDMLSKIVNMDEKVRVETKQAEQRKADSFKKIAQKRDAIYNDYISRARERIKKNAKAEQDAADEKLKQMELEKEACLERLDKLYKENGKQWIESIVENVINS